MISLVTVFIAVVVSLLITRVGSVALAVTGMSTEAARFQARSAFTGAGFTTAESEQVVGHPVRRRIVMLLMLLGNAGIVVVLSTLLISFVGAGRRQGLMQLGVLVVGLLAIWLVVRSAWFDRRLSRAIAFALRRWTDIENRDYASLLHLGGEWTVMELKTDPRDWLVGRTLGELDLREEGVVVLGVNRPDGEFIGVPNGATRIGVGDTLILYGPKSRVCELDVRPAGDEGERAHEHAVAEHVRRLRAERLRDKPQD